MSEVPNRAGNRSQVKGGQLRPQQENFCMTNIREGLKDCLRARFAAINEVENGYELWPEAVDAISADIVHYLHENGVVRKVECSKCKGDGSYLIILPDKAQSPHRVQCSKCQGTGYTAYEELVWLTGRRFTVWGLKTTRRCNQK